MSNSIAQREQSIQTRIDLVRKKIGELEFQSGALSSELDGHSRQRQQYHLLHEICASLDKLSEMGAGDLFWGKEAEGYDPTQQLNRVRSQITEFESKITALEKSRSDLLEAIKRETIGLTLLQDELLELKAEEEELENEYQLVRLAAEIPFRPMLMPWTTEEEDRKRFRKILLIAFIFSILIAVVLPLFRKPPSRFKDVVVPEHLAQIIKRKQEEIKQIEQKPQEKLAERSDNTAPSSKATTAEVQKARAVAQTKGVLAFKNNFADLIDDAPAKLGAQARVSNAGSGPGPGNGGKYAPGEASTRSMIVSQATGGSGGINTAGLSRSGTGSGGGGQSITGGGVRIARVESATGAGVADDRPLSKGAGPARTDEEIQIVFDRYKAALYRIYNRELRNDPSLKGKMVLRITIEPDGRVSACSVKSTDLNSAALSADIVSRVMSFNFGPKQGVSSLTILYPIDFLPAT